MPTAPYPLAAECVEARNLIEEKLGEGLWDNHTEQPDRESALLKVAHTLIMTYEVGKQTRPDSWPVPVTLVLETVEAVLGRKVY